MICRLCVNNTEFYLRLKIIKENGEESHDIAAVIGKHFDLCLDVNTDIICHVCWQQLNEFHQFYKYVEEKQKEWGNPYIPSVTSEGIITSQGKPFNEQEMDIKQEPFENEPNVCTSLDLNTSIAEVKYEDVKCDVTTRIDASKFLAILKKIPNKNADNHRSESSLYNAVPTETVSAHEMDMESEAVDEVEIKCESLVDVTLPMITESSLSQWNEERSPLKTSEILKNIETTSSRKMSNVLKNRILRIKKRYLEQNVKRIKSNILIAKHGAFKCDLCEQKLENFGELKQHFKTEHKRIGYVVCCDRRHFARTSYADHLAWHLNQKHTQWRNVHRQSTSKSVFTSASTHCEICDMHFTSKKSLKLHKTTAHAVSSEYWIHECPFCLEKFPSGPKLSQHMRKSHRDEKFTCHECNKDYKNLSSFRNHKRNVHNRSGKFKCDICDVDFRDSTHVKIHKANVHNVAESWDFECSSCPRKFPLKVMLNSHIRESHTQQSLTCKECNEDYKSSADLYEHKKVVHNQSLAAECDICGRRFADEANCNKHKGRVHNMTKSSDFQCPFCPNKFPVKYRLSKHIRDSHRDQTFTCEECNKTFITFNSLINHKKLIHLKVYETVCDVCGNRFSSRSQCKIHQASVHGTESGGFSCLICHKKFPLLCVLNKHMRCTHEKRDDKLPCDVCTKEFPNKRALTHHKNYVHLKAHVVECDICGKQYTCKKALEVHKASVHKVAKNWDFQCTLCPMKFSLNFLLKEHIRDRHNEKQLKCAECNKEYNSLNSLKNHQRRDHLKKYTVDCDICGMSFLTSSQLKYHAFRVHKTTETLGFQCPQCPKKFQYLSSLHRHTRCHKNNKTKDVSSKSNKEK